MSEGLLRHLDDRGVHRVIMDHGANALDGALMDALRERIAALAAVGAPPLLLASSHPSIFCPGWDLKELVEADRERVANVLAAFNGLVLDLFSYPGPTAVAITGHAVAGGCLLAMAADLRVMATGQPRLGFAELNLGLPVPAACIRMLRSKAMTVDEVVLAGEGCSAERGYQLGLIQHAVSLERAAAVADRELRKLASKPAQAYAATKAFLHGPDWRAMASEYAEQDGQFLDLWFTDEAQRRIRDVVRGLGE
jgi:enoyl-CoA hydratase